MNFAVVHAARLGCSGDSVLYEGIRLANVTYPHRLMVANARKGLTEGRAALAHTRATLAAMVAPGEGTERLFASAALLSMLVGHPN